MIQTSLIPKPFSAHVLITYQHENRGVGGGAWNDIRSNIALVSDGKEKQSNNFASVAWTAVTSKSIHMDVESLSLTVKPTADQEMGFLSYYCC